MFKLFEGGICCWLVVKVEGESLNSWIIGFTGKWNGIDVNFIDS